MKNLKTVLGAFALVAVSALCLTSCGNKENKAQKEDVKATEEVQEQNENTTAAEEKTIEDFVDEARAMCPFELGEGITITEINYDGKVYENVIVVEKSIFEVLKNSGVEVQVQAGIKSAKTQLEAGDPFTVLLYENEVSTRLRYTCEGEEFVVYIPADAVK